jgi:hypothetical protein
MLSKNSDGKIDLDNFIESFNKIYAASLALELENNYKCGKKDFVKFVEQLGYGIHLNPEEDVSSDYCDRKYLKSGLPGVTEKINGMIHISAET